MGQQGRIATNSPGSWRKGYRWVLICCLLLPTYAWSSEAALRVAFVYNFLKFIEWPQSASSPLTLCALDAQDDMRKALDLLANRSLNKRPIQLVYLDDKQALATGLPACHLLYWTGIERRFVLPELLPPGVVLVADEANATLPGVSIGLYRTRDGRIEFAINEAAVTQAGVRISSQLLKLAKNHRDDGQKDQGGSND